MTNNEVAKEENNSVLNQILDNLDNKSIKKDELIETLQNELNDDINILKNEKMILQIQEPNNSDTKTSTKQISTSAKSIKQNSLQNEVAEEKKEIIDIKNEENINNNDEIEEEKYKVTKNIDDIPIKSNKLNFNQLLEKELSKEGSSENNINNISDNKKVEPKFKYISKKKNDIEFKKPIKNKKYKYYTDNFKLKPVKKAEIGKKSIKEKISKNNEKNKKEKIIKNQNNEIKNNLIKKKNDNKSNNNIINNNIKNTILNKIYLEGDNEDFQNENENKDIISNDNNKNNENNNYAHNNDEIEDEDNVILMNNYVEMKKAEIERIKKSKKSKEKDIELIKILNNNEIDNFINNIDIYEEEYENDIKKISDYLYKKNQTNQSKDNFMQEISNIINTKNINNNISNDNIIEDLEMKEIFEQFSNNLNMQKPKKTSSKSKKKKENKKIIKKKQNSNKIKNNIRDNNKYKPIEESVLKKEDSNENNYFYKNEENYNGEDDMGINELVSEKKNELKKYLEILKKEKNNVNELKKEYEKINLNYKSEINGHERKKEELKNLYNIKKEEEIKKIEEEKTILKNETLFTDFPREQKVNEVLYLQNEIEKIDIEIKNREEYFKKTIEKLENQYIEVSQFNIELRKKLKFYEDKNERNNNYEEE